MNENNPDLRREFIDQDNFILRLHSGNSLGLLQMSISGPDPDEANEMPFDLTRYQAVQLAGTLQEWGAAISTQELPESEFEQSAHRLASEINTVTGEQIQRPPVRIWKHDPERSQREILPPVYQPTQQELQRHRNEADRSMRAVVLTLGMLTALLAVLVIAGGAAYIYVLVTNN